MSHLLDAQGSCRVLVVEDDRDAADSLVLPLHACGFRAQAVYDGAQAVLAEKALQPSLVLIDLEMANVDGYTAATVIRRACPARHVRMVALTGHNSDTDRVLSACVGLTTTSASQSVGLD